VGSAAFNLFFIGAVCVGAIPGEEYSKINQYGVFVFTASASIFAYLWLFIVLSVNSPNQVDLYEAIITLLFFPLLIIGAYAQDQYWCGGEPYPHVDDDDDSSRETKEEMIDTPITTSSSSSGSMGTPVIDRNQSPFLGGRKMSRLTSTLGTSRLIHTPSGGRNSQNAAPIDVSMLSRTFISEDHEEDIEETIHEDGTVNICLQELEKDQGHTDGEKKPAHANHVKVRAELTKVVLENNAADLDVHDIVTKVKIDESMRHTQIAFAKNARAALTGSRRTIVPMAASGSTPRGIAHLSQGRKKSLASLSSLADSIHTQEQEERESVLGPVMSAEEEDTTQVNKLSKTLSDGSHTSSTRYSSDGSPMGHRVPPMGLVSIHEDAEMRSSIYINGAVMQGNAEVFPTFNFSQQSYSVKEDVGEVTVTILCENRSSLDKVLQIHYRTVDATAIAQAPHVEFPDYVTAQGTLEFPLGVSELTIDIKLCIDAYYEPEKFFLVRLDSCTRGCEIEMAQAGVTIVNDDYPGILGFQNAKGRAMQTKPFAWLQVRRWDGCSGPASVSFKTEDGAAGFGETAAMGVTEERKAELMETEAGRMLLQNDYTFVHREGVLEFGHLETVKSIKVSLLEKPPSINDIHQFRVVLSNAQPVAGPGEPKKAGVLLRKHRTTCVVSIISDEAFGEKINMAALILEQSEQVESVGGDSFREQFREALVVHGELDEQGDELPPSISDEILHLVSIGWKVLFALCPPTSICGGWATFWVSLAMIGMITAVIGDTAELFGCVLGLEDSVTAITFVALGTSLPDTFASWAAALESADAAIGNITGSNAVNVFLGLGLPWFISSWYYESRGEVFKQPAGSLATSVFTYTLCAIACIFTLVLRRSMGGELGGPTFSKWATVAFFILLWFIYVLVSSLVAYKFLDGI